jgi:hypothetical protein
MRIAVLCAALVLFSAAGFAQPAGQQPSAGQPPAGQPPAGLAPGEVQRLLDGFALVQAQDFLALSDAQFNAFVPKLRVLQEARRHNEQERLKLLQELRQMTNGRMGQVPESDLHDRLRLLRELETRAAGEIQRAMDGVDQTLDVRQQARFRLFEQQIEQRKLQLLMRAREMNRANRPPAQ